MRRKMLKDMLSVMLLVALLLPFAHLLSNGQDRSGANDADYMVKPMLEDAWAIEDTREES